MVNIFIKMMALMLKEPITYYLFRMKFYKTYLIYKTNPVE